MTAYEKKESNFNSMPRSDTLSTELVISSFVAVKYCSHLTKHVKLCLSCSERIALQDVTHLQ